MKKKYEEIKEKIEKAKKPIKEKIEYAKNYIVKMYDEMNEGIDKMFEEFFDEKTNKKQRANMWTFSRLLMAGLVPILTIFGLATGMTAPILFALGATAFGGVADYFDGVSARKYNSTSEFGEKFDFVTDKLFAAGVGTSLALINPLFILPLIGEAAIAGTNLYYKTKEPKIKSKSSNLGKRKQWPLFGSFIAGFASKLIPGLSIITNILLGATLVMQGMTAYDYAKTYEKEIAEIKKQEAEETKDGQEPSIEPTKEKAKVLTEEAPTKDDKVATKEAAEAVSTPKNDAKQAPEVQNKEDTSKPVMPTMPGEPQRQAIAPITRPPEGQGQPKKKVLTQPKDPNVGPIE